MQIRGFQISLPLVVGLCLGACEVREVQLGRNVDPETSSHDQKSEYPAKAPEINSRDSAIGVDGISIGMSVSQVREFKNADRRVVSMPDDSDAVIYVIESERGVQFELWMDLDDKVGMIVTRAAEFQTNKGASLNTKLSELRVLYPRGRVLKGQADGLYFIFDTGEDGVDFSFDAFAIGRSCVVNDKDCPSDVEDRRPVEVRIYRH